MRCLFVVLLFGCGTLFASDIRLDTGEERVERSTVPELSAAGKEKSESLAEFAAFLNGVIASRGKTDRFSEQTLNHLYRALEKDPGSEELLTLVGADLAEQRGELPERVKRLMAFAKQHPDQIRLCVLLAGQLARSGKKTDRERIDAIIELVEAAWKTGKGMKTDSPEMERLLSARILEALLLASQEKFDEADEVISDVLERIPEKRRAEALQSAMSIYLEAQKKASDEKPFLIGFLVESDKEKFSRKFESASQDFIRILSQPGVDLDPEKFLTSAAIFEREGKKEYSLLILMRPLYSDPEDLGSLRRLAAFYYSEKQFANAARLWKRIVELGGGRAPMDSYLYALSLLRSGDAKGAFKAFEAHYKRFPNDVKSLNQYALAAWLAEEYERLPGIVNAIPKPSPDFLYLKGSAEQILRRYGDALKTMLRYERSRKWEDEGKRTSFRMGLILLADKAKRLDVAERFLLPMLEADPDARYADILEREIYNGTISGMQLDGTKFFYINQLEANPGMPTNAYGEEEYTPERIGWYDCACCPPNLARLMTSLGSYVWSSSEDTIYSHLFVGGTAIFETAGGVKIALTSKYPWNGSVTYTVEPEQAGAEFTLAVRYPGWCHQMQVKVNGIPVSGAVKTDKGYWMIQRSWQPGDTVSCEMEREPERVYAHPMVRADAGCVALRRGPIIYTFEGVDNGEDLQTLRIPREAKIEALPYQADLLEGIVALRVTGCRKKTAVNPALYAEDVAPEERVTLQAIPYYAWCNRGMTHMRVWMQE